MRLAQWEINDEGMVLAHKGLPIIGGGGGEADPKSGTRTQS